MTDEIGLFEAMHTQRALRYIAPDPHPRRAAPQGPRRRLGAEELTGGRGPAAA